MSIDPSLLERVREVTYKHALLNAIKHSGRADLNAVVSKVVGEIPEIRKNIRALIEVLKSIVEEVNKLTHEEQQRIVRENWPELLEEKPQEYRKELPPLPNAVEGKVVTRMAPNPDFSLHLGNARPALLNYWYAKMYKGKMILRFEDTDPRIKAPYPDAYESVKEDLKWLDIVWDEEYIQSLRLEIYYSVAKELIKRGGAYTDLCDNKTFKSYRNRGKACPHRDKPVETQLEEFEKMLKGYYGEGEAVLRVKTDLEHPDLSVREWVAFRVVDTTNTPHPIVGEKYIVWPTYNFAAAIDDHLMGVTHILRAKEHITNTAKQKYLYAHMGWKYPETIHFGRLSLEGVILSKSKMRKLIAEKNVASYADPRLGTIQGFRRRGIVRETIWELIKTVGIKGADAKVSLANLFAINRTIVDPVANRYMAVEDPVYLVLRGMKEELKALIPIHPSKKEHHTYVITDGTEVMISRSDFLAIQGTLFRLMGLANFIIKSSEDSKGLRAYVAELHSLEYDVAKKYNTPIIQWVPTASYLKATMLKPTGLDLEERTLYVERRIVNEKVDSVVQLYRIGFARVDDISENNVVLIFAHE